MPARKVLPLAVLVVLALIALPAVASAKPKRHRIDITAATKMVRTTPDLVVTDRGTVSGKPFDEGRIKLVVQLDFLTATAAGTFRIRDDRGTVFGEFDMPFVIGGGEIDFNGTADFTGGKGAYKRIRGTGLKAHDHNTFPDGQNGVVELKGFARY
jgi:hypothetical protein